jgi:hypothetical protein
MVAADARNAIPTYSGDRHRGISMAGRLALVGALPALGQTPLAAVVPGPAVLGPFVPPPPCVGIDSELVLGSNADLCKLGRVPEGAQGCHRVREAHLAKERNGEGRGSFLDDRVRDRVGLWWEWVCWSL